MITSGGHTERETDGGLVGVSYGEERLTITVEGDTVGFVVSEGIVLGSTDRICAPGKEEAPGLWRALILI
jgi:hypothetical protein